MKKLGFALLLVVASLSLGSATRANAKGAGVDKVIGACKRTAGCTYTSTGAGEGYGCSATVCFICKNSKCFAASKGGGGSKGGVLGGVRLPPGTVQPASGGKTAGGRGERVHHPVDVDAPQPPTSVKQPVTGGKSGGMGQGGGHHR